MKIIGNKESVNQISLTHKGINARFNCFMKPFPYCNDIDTSNPEIIEIIFKDSYEIDNLIDVLEKFKKNVLNIWESGDDTMKNKEKYAKEIVEIACDGNRVAVVRQTGEFRSCYETPCIECLFHSYDKEQCKERTREWAESEYIEKPVISKKDKAFLEYVKEEHKCIARDRNGELFLYRLTPYKEEGLLNWIGRNCSCLHLKYNVDFPMVKWEDSEPWLIEDLKKLEGVDSYE